MLLFHTVVNVGMAMGVLPITGIPLLLVSYGGSSLWTALIGVGLLANIGLARARRGRARTAVTGRAPLEPRRLIRP